MSNTKILWFNYWWKRMPSREFYRHFHIQKTQAREIEQRNLENFEYNSPPWDVSTTASKCWDLSKTLDKVEEGWACLATCVNYASFKLDGNDARKWSSRL